MSGDRSDLDNRELLAVALALTVARLVLVLDDGDLRTLGGVNDLCLDGDLLQTGLVNGDGIAIYQHQGLKFDGSADFCCHLVDNYDVTDGHLLLSAAGLDDRVDHVKAHLCHTYSEQDHSTA